MAFTVIDVAPSDAYVLGMVHVPIWRALLVTIYSTAMRLREAINLLWGDIDFESGQLHVTRKTAGDFVQAWTPKDHEKRAIPLPKQAISLLTTWRNEASEGCPYVFMEHDRWEYYRQEVTAGRWRDGMDLVNNILRRFHTLCRKVKVTEYSIHDLRRSCITNWAKVLPIHVVQQLAGHSDIKTTQEYYLSVQAEDIQKAQAIQVRLLGKLPKMARAKEKSKAPQRERVFPGK